MYIPKPLAVLVAAAVLALGLSGCGSSGPPIEPTSVESQGDAVAT